MNRLGKNELVVGSMLWLDPWWSAAKVEEQVRGMVSRGLRVARIFLSWSGVQPEEDRWDYSLFDGLFRQAEKYGLYITLTLSAGSVPKWARDKIENPNLRTLDNPEIWRLALRYVEETAKRYKDSAALHSWILWNEPSKATVPNAFTLPKFRRFVALAHGGDSVHLQNAYFSSVSGPEDIGALNGDGSGSLPELAPRVWGYGCKADWQRFCIEDMNRMLADIRNAILRVDTSHPTTVNPCHVGWQLLNNGQDIWSEGDLVDFLGCSCHTCSYDRPLFNRKHQHLSLVVDAIRSATNDPEEAFWLTELQAGSIVYAGVQPFTPTASDITHWLWEAFGSGAKAVVYWLYEARTSGYEGSEWGLVNQYGGDSERSLATQRVAALLRRHQDFFAALRPAKPDVYVLYSLASEHIGAMEVEVGAATHGLGDTKNVQLVRNYKMGGDSMFGAYSMAQDIGCHCGFAYEKHVTKKLPKDGVLLCGGAVCLPDNTVSDLKKWVWEGGTLIVDSIFAQKDMWGATAFSVRDDLAELFGTRMLDIHSQQEELYMDCDGSQVPGWFVSCEFDETRIEERDVLARFSDGRVAAFRHAYGKGTAIWIGTMFFQRYTACPTGEAGEFLRRLFRAPQKPAQLVNPSRSLRMKRLAGNGEEVCILLNYEEGKLARIFTDGAASFTDMETNEVFRADSPAVLSIPMKRESTRILRVSRNSAQ